MAVNTPLHTIAHPYARARFDLKAQQRFLACIEECGRIGTASRWAKVSRRIHYWWLDEDPTYPARFQAARARFTQALEDEAIRRAHDGVRKLVLYKGEPVFYQGEQVFEHIYSDHLMIKLLEAGDPDRFNRQKVAPFDEDFDFDKMTEGQTLKMLEWLKKRIETAKSLQAMREPAQLAGAEEPTPAVESATISQDPTPTWDYKGRE
jgi:hypothetical protein